MVRRERLSGMVRRKTIPCPGPREPAQGSVLLVRGGAVTSALASIAYATVLDPLAAAPLLAGAVLSGGSVRSVVATALLTILLCTVLRMLQQTLAFVADRLRHGVERMTWYAVVVASGVVVTAAVVAVAVRL